MIERHEGVSCGQRGVAPRRGIALRYIVALAAALCAIPQAIAITAAEQETLLKLEGTRTHPDALALADKLGKEGDLTAAEFLLNNHRLGLAARVVRSYFSQGASANMKPFESLFLAHRSDPQIRRMLLDGWVDYNWPNYSNPALFDVLLGDLQNDVWPPGLSARAAQVILRTNVPNADERVLDALSRMPLPSVAPLTRPPPIGDKSISAIGADGWSELTRRFVDHEYITAIPSMRGWLANRLAGDPFATAIDVALIRFNRPEAIEALRERMSFLAAVPNATEARREFNAIAYAFARLDIAIPTPYAQVSALVPPEIRASSEDPWPDLRRREAFTPAAHALIRKIVAHYQGLDTYADSGTIQSSMQSRSGDFETRFTRHGRYLIVWSGVDGQLQIDWGYPGCANRYLSFSGRFTTHDCEPKPVELGDLNSPAISIAVQGAQWFYKTGYSFLVEPVEGDSNARVRLKGIHPDHPEQYLAYLIDPAIGSIATLEIVNAGRRVTYYELHGRDNPSIPIWEWWPWRGVLGQFAPWKVTPRGFAGGLLVGGLLGASAQGLGALRRRRSGSAVVQSLVILRSQCRRLAILFGVALGLIGIAMAILFFVIPYGSIPAAMLLAYTLGWGLPLLMVTAGFFLGALAVVSIRFVKLPTTARR
jgi:hypothetical protein